MTIIDDKLKIFLDYRLGFTSGASARELLDLPIKPGEFLDGYNHAAESFEQHFSDMREEDEPTDEASDYTRGWRAGAGGRILQDDLWRAKLKDSEFQIVHPDRFRRGHSAGREALNERMRARARKLGLPVLPALMPREGLTLQRYYAYQAGWTAAVNDHPREAPDSVIIACTDDFHRGYQDGTRVRERMRRSLALELGFVDSAPCVINREDLHEDLDTFFDNVLLDKPALDDGEQAVFMLSGGSQSGVGGDDDVSFQLETRTAKNRY